MDLRSLTFEEVDARADEIDRRYREEAERVGYASTVQGTEDDDWLALRSLMRIRGARRIQDLELDEIEEFAERMERHASG